MLDLHRLRLLKEFADRGTITATAAALGYTPSAVSQQLAALEREIGDALLDRAARSVELTDAGRRLAVHAEIILAQVEAAEADLAAQAREPSGRVTVAAFPTAAVAFAPALARSLRAHPALTMLLQQAAPTEEGLRRVRSGEADVALVDDWTEGGLSDQLHPMLRSFRLLRDPLVLIVPRSHPLADPATPVDLRKLCETSRWMAAPAGEPSRVAADRLLAAAGGAPAVPWEFEGLGAIIGLVGRGIGVAAVPRLAIAAGEGRVAVRELAGPVPTRAIFAVARAASVRRPSVALALSSLADGAASLAGRAAAGTGRARLSRRSGRDFPAGSDRLD
ncbi:MAG: LysR family transcriptional regulator [Actinobacteria bacterium]|nr:LysR family transcriptional regulator [Actinomycetota bacterium]MBO0787831.1 LysR family transcriptional regulator [Actinomycetota bacterium]